MIKTVLSWLTGGALSRVFDTIDKTIESQTDRERLKADVIKEHLNTRSDFMRAGGFVLMLLFAVPLAVWWAGVILYSLIWCADCVYPQTWTIAALPSPLNEWAGLIVVSIFGVIGIAGRRR